jgi:hypothetical protein
MTMVVRPGQCGIIERGPITLADALIDGFGQGRRIAMNSDKRVLGKGPLDALRQPSQRWAKQIVTLWTNAIAHGLSGRDE